MRLFVGWSTECLQDWGRFARIAIPGMFMVCLEWWGFEIGVFLSGLLGTTELGAQSVVLQIDSIWFQVRVCAVVFRDGNGWVGMGMDGLHLISGQQRWASGCV